MERPLASPRLRSSHENKSKEVVPVREISESKINFSMTERDISTIEKTSGGKMSRAALRVGIWSGRSLVEWQGPFITRPLCQRLATHGVKVRQTTGGCAWAIKGGQ